MQFFEIFQKVTILYIRINIRNNIMKYFWWIIFIIILLLIYPIALYAAIKVQDESLESFIILNFGLQSFPVRTGARRANLSVHRFGQCSRPRRSEVGLDQSPGQW